MRAHGRAWAGRAPAFSFGALSHVPTLKGGGSDNLLYNILYNTIPTEESRVLTVCNVKW